MPPRPRRDRPLFDPSRMTGAKEAAPAKKGAHEQLTVSQLNGLIDSALKDGLPPTLRVVGEISGLSDRTHWYFSLKDAEAVVSCVMFASDVRKMVDAGVRPVDGMQVVATGRIEHYARQGRTQLYVRSMAPVGAGALDAKLRALIEELRGLGWLDEDRKKPIPPFPRRIALVTSKTSAACQDVLKTMSQRFPAVDVLLVDVRVQSDPPTRSAAEIARAIAKLSKQHKRLGVDAIVLTRGGGSLEDLWAFNERVVAEAILACEIPVVAAIGHETDTTIAELVADLRASTPTQAAMRVTPDKAALAEQLERSEARLSLALRRRVEREGERVRAIARHPHFTNPGARIDRAREQVDGLERRLNHSARARVSAASMRLERLNGRLGAQRPEAVYAARGALLTELRSRLGHAVRERLRVFDPAGAERSLARAWSGRMRIESTRIADLERTLHAVGPTSVLQRGYSITVTPKGAVIRSASDVRSGEVVETRLGDGSFRSVVDGAGRGQRKRKSRKDAPDQMDLFR